MANGMGSLYVGASGLQNSQNALNTTANNLANVDTKGYVRQQVLFAEKNYRTYDKGSAFSYQQVGLGVTIGDVVHTRDVFLDKYYRNAAGRQAFYSTTYESVTEIEDFFQELEGVTYQETLNDFCVSFQELAKLPDSGVNQNLVIQKATLFLERAQAIYDSTKKYQQNMNVQISDTVDRINELGKTIQELNVKIMAIESGGVETAMTLRDERDNALDELSGLANIEVKENAQGIVKVKIEGVSFVDEVRVNEIGLNMDKKTEFMTPYWKHLSDEDKGAFYEVFDFSTEIKNNSKADSGKLKALMLARGDHFANHTDLIGITNHDYNVDIKQSVVMNAQAELDQLIHTIAKAINDTLCPNKEVSFVGADGKAYNNVLVWDKENGAVGTDGDGESPGHELFVRNGCERYTKVTADDGTVYYVYNEEDINDPSTQYGVGSMMVNEILIQEESHFPHIKADGSTDWALAKKLEDLWTTDMLKLNPEDVDKCTFKEYYQRLIDDLADSGSVCKTLSETLTGSVNTIENQRQQVIGVSSDEELTNMIKYQNAYNAASRYINVISEMLEHIIVQLGA